MMEENQPKKSKRKKRSEGLVKHMLQNRHKHRTAKSRAMHCISFGYSREEIIKLLQEEFGYSESTCIRIYTEANKELQYRANANAKKIAERNLARLDALIEESYDEGNFKDVIKAIDIQNKMTGQYETKVNVTTDTETPFTIKINQ